MSDKPTAPASQTGPGSNPRGLGRPPGLGRLRGTSRMTKFTCIGAALAIAVITVISLTGNGAGARPRTPPAARNFSLRALGHPGQRVSLAAFAGRPVVINFFASWCAPCQRETPALARFYRQSGGRVAIIGVDSNDQARAAMRFVHAAGVRYPVGVDPLPASTTSSYGVIALPQTFFLNARHRIVKRVFGAVTLKELSAGVALMTSRPSGAPQTPGAGGG